MYVMRITPIHLHKNKLITNYRQHESQMMKYFDEAPFASLENRYTYLMEQSYHRTTLVDALIRCNEQWGASKQAMVKVNKLKDPKSVVVIGGQQAGLLTGPLYTLNKVISIITYAKQQEKKLGVPVVPVFWIAGEDHDYDEINHAYYLQQQQLVKHTIKQQLYQKQSLTNIEMDKPIVADWYKQIIQSLQETMNTKHIHQMVNDCFEKSTTYVDFFARMIHQLFKEEGIVLIDSGDEMIRQLESRMFEKLIIHQQPIATGVYETKQQLQREGYSIDLEVDEEDAHLFYHDKQHERILLKREQGKWLGKNNEVQLTTEEMLTIAKETPERLSNNVVTRPLMQEYLFPVLAFIAGDGEIAYWATLKRAFHALHMKMPPIIPRLSFTFVTAKMEKQLSNRSLTIEHVIEQGTKAIRDSWLAHQSKPTIQEIIEEARQQMEKAHEPIQRWADEFRSDMAGIAKKNLQLINHHLSYVEERMERALQEKYTAEWNEFLLLEQYFYPNQGLQERVWNPLPLLNEYGLEWIKQVGEADFSFEHNHFIIYLI